MDVLVTIRFYRRYHGRQSLRVGKAMGKSYLKLFLVLLSLGSTELVCAEQAFSSESKWMLGDWNGKRSALAEQGYDFSVTYSGQAATILDTSINSNKDTGYADQWSFTADLDLSKILNWDDTQAFINITKRDGNQIENKDNILSSHISQVQEVYGRGQTWRLTDLWIKKSFLNNELDIKVGRFGEGEDFASLDCEFENLALCGGQIGHWSGDQWYNSPVSQWATRLKWNISTELAAQIGVYEVNPENLKRSKGFNLSTNGSEGALIPIELIWKPVFTEQKLTGEYRFGYYYSTVDAKNVQTNTVKTENKSGVWIAAKQQLTSHADDTSRGLSVIGQVAIYDNETSIYNDVETIAFVYEGLSNNRPTDEVGFGVSRIAVDSKFNPDLDYELNAELYYEIQMSNWLKFRPNIQYIDHIGANSKDGSAWVAGMKFNTSF